MNRVATYFVSQRLVSLRQPNVGSMRSGWFLVYSSSSLRHGLFIYRTGWDRVEDIHDPSWIGNLLGSATLFGCVRMHCACTGRSAGLLLFFHVFHHHGHGHGHTMKEESKNQSYRLWKEAEGNIISPPPFSRRRRRRQRVYSALQRVKASLSRPFP